MTKLNWSRVHEDRKIGQLGAERAKADPPTEKQLSYLRNLLDRRGFKGDIGQIDKRTCSQWIESLVRKDG